MNSIVTLKRLVELLSKASGKNMAYVDAYIRAFTDTVRSAVAAGDTAKVKGLGTFSFDPAKRAIVFEPDAELAHAVNGPFAMFAPEEVAPNVDDDIADPDFIFDIDPIEPEEPVAAEAPEEPEAAEIAEPAHAPIVAELEPERGLSEVVTEPAPTPQPAPAPIAAEPEPERGLSEVVTEPAPAPQPAPAPVPQPAPQPAPQPIHVPVPEPIPQPEPAEYSEYPDEEEDGKPSFPVFWVIWSAVIGTVIGLLIGFLLHDPIIGLFEPSLKSNAPEASVEASAAAPAPTATKTESLSSLAEKHYGNKNYWVYIYLENKDKITDPNNVPADLELVIPPKEKYATADTEAENVAAAKHLANETLEKFK